MGSDTQWAPVAQSTQILRGCTANAGYFLAALALLWWCRELSFLWNALPDFGFGWLVLLLFAFVVWERWAIKPSNIPARWDELWGGVLGAAGAPLILTAELFCWGVGRTPASCFVLSAGTLLYCSGVILYFHGRVAWQLFLFPLLFLCFAVPPPRAIWAPLVLALQSAITAVNFEILTAMGIPAHQMGNTIHLPSAVVAVDEACSGVRSLQACLMAATFLSFIMLQRGSLRFVCILFGIGFALLGNLLRSLGLCLTMYWEGRGGLDRWHDKAGWSILVFAAVGLGLTAWFLARLEARQLEVKPACKT